MTTSLRQSRCRRGLTYLKNRVTKTNQKHTIESQTPKRREHKYNTKENSQITKGKAKKEGQGRNIKTTGKQGLK